MNHFYLFYIMQEIYSCGRLSALLLFAPSTSSPLLQYLHTLFQPNLFALVTTVVYIQFTSIFFVDSVNSSAACLCVCVYQKVLVTRSIVKALDFTLYHLFFCCTLIPTWLTALAANVVLFCLLIPAME